MSQRIQNFCKIALIISALWLGACSGDKDEEESASTTPAPSDEDAPAAGSPLYVNVSTKYEGNENSVAQGSCYFETTDTVPSTKTCVIRIPELTLYFSDLHLSVGTSDATYCTQIAFSPYYYRKSNANPYADQDCTSGEFKECWGGAAPDIIEDFPKVKGLYFLPANSLFKSFKVTSTNSRFLADELNDISLYGNAGTCNNLATGARTTPLTNSNIEFTGGAGDYHDYTFTCADQWGELQYQITLVIADYDTPETPNTPGKDHFWDWDD